MDKYTKELEEMEEFDFKPITKGLGFHHSIEEKSKIKTSLKTQQKSLANEIELRSEKLKAQNPVESTHVQHMGELSAFYNTDTINTASIPPLVTSEPEELVKDVTLSLRFVAWLVDTLVVTLMFVVAVALIFIFSEMPFDTLSTVMVSNDIIPSFGLIFFMFYLFYFSFLDKTDYSTIGKRMFKMKLMGIYSGPSLVQTLVRSLLTVVSVVTLGLFSLLSLQDSLTDTKVVRRK